MKGITKVKVNIKWGDNRIKCICVQEGCTCKDRGDCEADSVAHDKYKDWEKCFSQNRYGK